jgi:nickel-type superoxide dismutase maturation protease
MPGWTFIVALIALPALVLLLVRRTLLVVRVHGPSMLPTFEHGDAVLAVRIGLDKRLRKRLRPGDIVVCRLPPAARAPASLVIKRVREADDEEVFLVGDGPHSYDSRQFGPVATGHVVGRVVARLHL